MPGRRVRPTPALIRRHRRRRCPSWCARPTDHDGAHERTLAEIVGDVTTVYLRLHALPPEREPSLVISIGFTGKSRRFCSTTVSWESAEELMTALGTATRDYAP